MSTRRIVFEIEMDDETEPSITVEATSNHACVEIVDGESECFWTPKEARQVAAALIACADAIEADGSDGVG